MSHAPDAELDAFFAALSVFDLRHVRPHHERVALALVRRLGASTTGENLDEDLMFWLDRGTRDLQEAAALAIGRVGTSAIEWRIRVSSCALFGHRLSRGTRALLRESAAQIRRRSRAR